MPIEVRIDGLTHSVEEVATGKSLATRIRRWADVGKRERRLEGWRFNWRLESETADRQVAALSVHTRVAIEGLVSFDNAGDHVFIHLVESAPHNIGKNKRYRGVPANLIAFACQQSVLLGYAGAAAFFAKSELVEHYENTLGAQRIGRSLRMIISEAAGMRLIETYFSRGDAWPL